ncbi:hypothetical protein SBP02_15070 [Pseudomonas benzenivorans]|uniref:Uncharacterized protein n=1 Tax=Pseudomonas benzenivorans TaxID=556533 RepID=A0ABZ0PU37_9PSED|nr:hypothetical protein [Pseudomonas benzenivorans]WPC04085.1 hypothetical protein SBP02_15070 [Pseudomonas benzenivorans]
MINGLAPLPPSSVAGGTLPAPSSEAEIRGYLDFQLLLSRLLPGPLAAQARDSADSEPPPFPDGIEPDPEHGQLIARLQLELGEHLQAHPERVEPLRLAMLADACEAFSRVMPAAQLPQLPALTP